MNVFVANRQMQDLLAKCANERFLYVDDLEVAEEKYPGLDRALNLRLIKGDSGGGWDAHTKYSLTRDGYRALGLKPPTSLLDAILRLFVSFRTD